MGWLKRYMEQIKKRSGFTLVLLLFIWTLLEDRLVGWANSKIDEVMESGSALLYILPLVQNMHIFIWCLVAISVLWILYDAYKQTTLGIFPDFAKEQFQKDLKKNAEENRTLLKAKNKLSDTELARRQALYIKEHENLRVFFERIIENDFIKIAWKPKDDGGITYIGKGFKPPEGKTMKDACDEAGVDLPFAEYIDYLPFPEEVEDGIDIQYFLKNKILEPMDESSQNDKNIFWYFPTEWGNYVQRMYANERI